jgi:predicted nucleic acid-binding protein
MERNPVIGDTGFVVALLNQADASHANVAAVYAQHLQIFLPQTVLAEVAYLVGRNGSPRAVVSFLRGLPASRFRLKPLTDQDLMRVAEILDEYADSRIDFVDATVSS